MAQARESSLRRAAAPQARQAPLLSIVRASIDTATQVPQLRDCRLHLESSDTGERGHYRGKIQ
jgi:hypothetical protein